MVKPGADAVSRDSLAGGWRIYQLRRGHRFSADDLLTAWAAVEARPEARTLLDLGAGIGSVGLVSLAKAGLVTADEWLGIVGRDSS
jgi:tRNA1(Val) A37 N6-methylase TrmN6